MLLCSSYCGYICYFLTTMNHRIISLSILLKKSSTWLHLKSIWCRSTFPLNSLWNISFTVGNTRHDLCRPARHTKFNLLRLENVKKYVIHKITLPAFDITGDKCISIYVAQHILHICRNHMLECQCQKIESTEHSNPYGLAVNNDSSHTF